MLELRGYQKRVVFDIRRSYLSGKRAPLLVMPTGSGKTVVFTHIALTSSKKNKKVLILLHRIELLRQTSNALDKFQVHHGLINPKYSPDRDALTQVASVQTVVKRLHKIEAPDLIIIDEAHHATAGTWRKIIDSFPSALVLGVTATPVRTDGSGLGKESGGIFDDLIIGPEISELIQLGFLVKPIVYAPKNKLVDLDGLSVRNGDYRENELAELMDKPMITGNAVEHYSKLCPGEPAVAFCVNIEHARHVAAQFRAAGFISYHVDGKMNDDYRSAILDGLGNGSVHVVTSCDIISEGTDIPAIRAAILLRPTQSLGLYIQQVGRALRPYAGKESALILDHVGNVLMHAMPDESRNWNLSGAYIKKNKKKNARNSSKTKAYQCEKCYAMHQPAPRCPVCGHLKVVDFKINEVEGELEQISPEQEMQINRRKVREVSEANSLNEFERIAEKRGYSQGWAKYKWNEKQRKLFQNKI